MWIADRQIAAIRSNRSRSGLVTVGSSNVPTSDAELLGLESRQQSAVSVGTSHSRAAGIDANCRIARALAQRHAACRRLPRPASDLKNAVDDQIRHRQREGHFDGRGAALVGEGRGAFFIGRSSPRSPCNVYLPSAIRAGPFVRTLGVIGLRDVDWLERSARRSGAWGRPRRNRRSCVAALVYCDTSHCTRASILPYSAGQRRPQPRHLRPEASS